MKNQQHHAFPGFVLAQEHYRAGRLQQAETICRKMPYNPDALHMRGVIAHQLNRNDEACELIGKAIRAMPFNASFHFSLDPVYRALGRTDDLIAAYQRLLERMPDHVDIHNNLGSVFKDQGRFDEAEACYRKAISLKPDFAEAYSNLGVVLKTQEKPDEAATCFQRAIAIKPDFAEAHANLGILFSEQDKPEDAALSLQNAIARRPDFAGAHTRLGSIYKQLEKLNEATASYRRALALQPHLAEAHYNLGCGLKDEGKLDEAIICYRDALTLRPDFAEAHNDLGVCFARLEQTDEAIASYRKAIALKPDYAEAYNGLGLALHAQGKPDEAIASFRKSLQHNPDDASAHHNLLLMFQYSATCTPEEMFAEHLHFAEQFEARLKPQWRPHSNSPDPFKRLKIGYVSADFFRHSAAYFIEPVLLRHDKSQFEIFCYYNRSSEDAVTRHLQSLADHWVSCHDMSHDQLAERIRADGIDILIDLSGHTGINRLLTFARKPAPVQVTYLGYPATTGLTAIDYRITDAYAEPPGMTEHLNVEQLWRLPEIFCCYRSPLKSPVVIDHPPAEDNGYVTFGCFNNFSKVTDPVLRLWARLLERVPSARLMLEIAGIDKAELRAEIENRLARFGIPAERQILIPRKSSNQYVLYNRIDIALDPFPCNGGTTTFDTVWMGVPLVTLAGRHFTSRLGVTILTNAGLPQLVANDEQEYLEIASALALDRERLKAVRSGLRERVQASPLMDASRFTKHLEQAYRGMWQRWCAGKSVASPRPPQIETAPLPSTGGPDKAITLNDLGNTLKEQGKLHEAAVRYREAIALDPACAAAYSNLAGIAAEFGNLDEAIAGYRKAIELRPDLMELHFNLGCTLDEKGDREEAAFCYRKTIALRPDFLQAHINLGNVLKDQGKLDEAIASYLGAIAIKANSADAFNNMGLAFAELGKADEAMTCFQTALEVDPGMAEAHNNLGIELKERGKLDEAMACLRKALELNPGYVDAHNNQGVVFQAQGRPDEAIACYRKALAYKPDYARAYHGMLLSMQYSAAWRPEEVFAAHVAFAEQFETSLKPQWLPHLNLRDPRKRLRIGYVSADFFRHSVAYSMEPVLACHDKSRFEVFCYYTHIRYDDFTHRLQALADHWVPCRHLSDDQLAERIRADGIDILIDLTGHTGDNRLLTFARKPAPVQVTYLGHPATSGLTAMDYRLTDAHAEPPGMTEHLNVEQLWRLPEIFCCYRALNSDIEVIDHPPAEDNGYITFGCFNNFSKVTDPVLRLWSQLLERVPSARLMLEIHGIDQPALRSEVENRLERLGIPVERQILVPRKAGNQYVLYNHIDIALDPFPCNGGTTSFDTVWMGVPLVTLAGRHFPSRLGVTILTNAGLPQLIAKDEQEYLEIASALALDRERLKAVRSGLRQRVQTSPLMDAPRFTRHLEQAYSGMWQKWCSHDMPHLPDTTPSDAISHNDAGNAFKAQGRFDDAIACYRKAIELDRNLYVAHYNLGLVLQDLGSLNDAMACYLNAIAIKPDLAEAHNNLGIIFAEQGKPDESITCHETALLLKPDLAEAHLNLGVARKEQGKPEEAADSFRKALLHNPDLAEAHHGLLFSMQHSASYTPEDLFAEHLWFAERFETPLKPHWTAHHNSRDARKRLRIGYVSPDLYRHAVAYSFEPVLANHDKSQFEIFCYYNGSRHDAVTERLRALADHWIACRNMSPDLLAERIRADGIDILIDLAGHTASTSLLAFARKPAPVQVTYLGYPCTTGLSAIDYRITDAHAEPPGMTEHLNVEQLWRLPEIFCCYRPNDNSPAPIGHPPSGKNGYITFGCFNNFSKVTDQVLALWARLLNQLPTARLMLEIRGIDNPAFRADVESRLVSLGLPLERIMLVPRKPENQYALYNHIDIALDPFPCNGGTTSFDTVWMGVPFVTLAGRHFISRIGTTVLTNAGLPQLIAHNEDEYVAIAAGLAQDGKRLQAIRAGLRERVRASPLMDAPRFTRHLEQAYRGMWQAWCDNKFAESTAEVRLDEAIDLVNMGNTLKEQGKLDEAVACYQQALALNPDFAEAYNNLGVAFADQGKFDEAITAYLKALAIKVDFAEAHSNLGLAFSGKGNPGDAIHCYQTALQLKPDFAEAHNNLGIELKERGDLDEAMVCYQNALAIRPDFPEAHCNRGITYHRQGRPDEAIACYLKALALKPDYVDAYQSLLLALQYSAKHDPQQIFENHLGFAKRFETPLKAAWTDHANARDPGKRLRIGYVSPDFHKHALAYSIEPVLQHHDRSQLEVFCYYNHTHYDHITHRLKELADHWVPCKHLSDVQLAERIRADGIDILIDLAGHSGGNRLLAFARKPAPVQATYLGYPCTTGLRSIDYRITDTHAEPPGMTEQFNTEQLWRLPEIFCCYRPNDNSPDVIDHLPAQDNGYVTFGCFNNFAKVTDPVLVLWARILDQVSDARLLLEIDGIDNPLLKTEVENRMVSLGLPLERITLVPRKPENQYVLYNRIDIALDPFPCNGGTTSLDSLWMGVPFVTLAGNHFTSRMGVTILTNAGLPQLIAQNEKEYVTLAIELARDKKRLQAIRTGLRERIKASPLMDARRLTRHLEQAYRGMWQAWCKNKQEEGSFA